MNKPRLIKKTFDKWYPDELQDAFGLRRTFESDLLNEWVSVNSTIPPEYLPIIEKMRLEMVENQSYWNEAELITKFVAPLLLFIHFNGENYSSFAERKLKAVIAPYEISGSVDWMAASGVRVPKTPYFFIHEYKRFKMGEADPLGQLLAEMFVAQTLNKDDLPLFGCYIVSNIWYFVVLNGKNYATSQGYDAADSQELTKIWSILQETKKRIESRLK